MLRGLPFLLAWIVSAFAQTSKSGELFADETWGPGSYTITSPGVYIMDGVTLTISGADITCDDVGANGETSWQTCFTVRGKLVVKDTFIGKHTSDARLRDDRSSKTAISHASGTASEVHLDGTTLRSMSTGISESCCHDGAITRVTNGVFDDLSSGISGYTGDSSKSSFTDAVFKYCDYAASGADHEFTNVTFENNGIAADVSRGSFSRCRFIDNDTAMKYGAPVDDAVFQGNALAIAPGCCGHSFNTLSSATFYGNTLAVKSNAGWNSWSALNFIDNDVNVEYTASSSSELDCAYWGQGTTTASDIRSTISRQVGGGDVLFDEFESEPHCHETFPCEYLDDISHLAHYTCFECICPIWNTTCREPCESNEHVISHVCVNCPTGSFRYAGDDPSGPDTQCQVTLPPGPPPPSVNTNINSSSPSSPNSPSSPSSTNRATAKETREKAEKTRDTMLNGVTDAKLKKKAKLLADAAISGKKVRKMSAKLTASDADTACSDYYSKAGLSNSLGACIATAASRRRSLAATTYDVSVFFSEAEVDDATLTSAENSLKAEGVTGVETSDPIDPISELGTIEGVDSSILETFKTEAAAAAATTPPSPPPPPGPPVPNLILDDDDHVPAAHGLIFLLTITALNFLL